MPISDNSNNILTVFTVPKLALTSQVLTEIETDGYVVLNDNFYATPIYLHSFIDALTTSTDFEGYVPRNRKLLQYPFTYLGFTSINGNRKIYRFEDFKNNQPDFEVESELNPNPNVCIIPWNYKRPTGQQEYKCTEEMCSLNGYPNISYKTDVFNTWLAQNQEILNLSLSQEATSYQQQTANNIMGLVQDSGNTGLSLANNLSQTDTKFSNSGNIISDIFNGITGAISRGMNQGFSQKNHELNIAMQMAQVEKQKMLPDQANLSSSATIMGYGLINDNIFNTYIIRRQFAEKIDKYFDMYGYKTNTVKIPNLNNRPNWNYVKTINANIIGNIPQNDLLTIKSFFDNGITLWHNTSTYLDYSQNNR